MQHCFGVIVALVDFFLIFIKSHDFGNLLKNRRLSIILTQWQCQTQNFKCCRKLDQVLNISLKGYAHSFFFHKSLQVTAKEQLNNASGQMYSFSKQ